MAERLAMDDLAEHVGCRHGIEVSVKLALRQFFTTRPSNTTQTVLVQLRARLTSAVPSVTWTTERAMRAVRAFVEDEA